MTVVSVEPSTGVNLICDDCGATAAADGYAVNDVTVVHVAVGGLGWSGSTFARGPHRCPACSRRKVAPRHRLPRSSAKPGIRVRHGPFFAVVTVTGSADAAAAGYLQQALGKAVTTSRYVVVDLSEADIVDPVIVSALVQSRNTALRRGRELVLAGPSRYVLSILRAAGATNAFRIFRNVPHARSSMSPVKPQVRQRLVTSRPQPSDVRQ